MSTVAPSYINQRDSSFVVVSFFMCYFILLLLLFFFVIFCFFGLLVFLLLFFFFLFFSPGASIQAYLTLKVRIVDGVFTYFYSSFSEKIILYISCEPSAQQTIYMKCQVLFSLKFNNK